MDDPFVGSLTFVRIYSGTVTSGSGVLNSTKDQRERVGRMLLMHANSREDIKEAYAGDIVAFASLKTTTTGETLCDSQQPVILEEDGISRSRHRARDRTEVESGSGEDGDGASAARPGRSVIPRIDRSGIRTDHPERHGRLHLDIKVDILRRTYKVDANVGAPQVAYRETLSRPVTIDYTHKKQTGGAGQDNPGAGGGNGDTTGLLAALLARRAPARCGAVHRSASAAQAHTVGIGFKSIFALDETSGVPGLQAARRRNSPCWYRRWPLHLYRSMFQGFRMDLGPMALLEKDGVVRRPRASGQAADQDVAMSVSSARTLFGIEKLGRVSRRSSSRSPGEFWSSRPAPPRPIRQCSPGGCARDCD